MAEAISVDPALRLGGRLPHQVETLVLSRWGWPAVTLTLTSLYLAAAVLEVEDFPTAVKVQANAGLKPPAAWAVGTMAVQVVGCAAIASGKAVWLGAGLLGGLTAAAEILTHRFWELEKGERRLTTAYAFFEHLGMIGGLLMTAIASNHRIKSRQTNRS